MLRMQLLVVLRTLWRAKSYAVINTVGLSIGIAGCILMALYLRDELAFDGFHSKADRIYRAVDVKTSTEQGTQTFGSVMGTIGPSLMQNSPDVEQTVRLLGRQSAGRLAVERGPNRFYVGDYYHAERNFFDVFEFPLLRGDPKTFLGAPRSIVLTTSSAKRYFGDEEPLGQTVNVERWGPMRVTGVVADPPPNSHLTFSMLFSFADLEGIEGWRRWMNDWSSDGFITYVVLRDEASSSTVTHQLDALIGLHTPSNAPETHKIRLQPLHDVHFGSSEILNDNNQNKSTTAYLYIFVAIAAFIAVVACINYTNLAAARALRRAREVGIRKVVGAHRVQLMSQFLGESIFLSLIAFILACGAVELILPSFNELSGKLLTLDLLGQPFFAVQLIGLALLVGTMAGIYPAALLSGFRPALVLKGSFESSPGRGLLRRGLVVLQFVVSVVLLIATMVVRGQMSYIQERQLGFQPHQLAVIDINSGNARQNFRSMKSEFMSVPGIRSVSVTSRVPGEWKNIVQVEGRNPAFGNNPTTMSFIGVDADFLETFEVVLRDGRNFSDALPGDSSAVIVNEAAVRLLGLTSPMGAHIEYRAGQGSGSRETNIRATIIGVVQDFHFRSLRESIQPIILAHWSNPIQSIDYFTVRLEKGVDLSSTITRLRTVGERYDPTHPFELNVLDDRLADFYVAEDRISSVFSVASGLSVLIACLGLFGLASYLTEQRTKEVGIRKVLGATAAGIFSVLTKDFLLLVFLANIIAWPLAYMLMSFWLEGFAYRLTPGADIFAAAAAVSFAIALISVGTQAMRGAYANPVESLRVE